MKEIKKHFYKKYLTIGTATDVDTGKVIFYQVFWNGAASKYKTKKTSINDRDTAYQKRNRDVGMSQRMPFNTTFGLYANP